jgi:ABC-type Fe3+/spermidine/putrescine transport system ATPase subunit
LTLRIDNISKTLGTFRLKDVNLEVADGEYFVLLGPTGSGKTVLLETIMGFHKPDKGRIVLDGRDITSIPIEKRGLGYVPQNCPLFPHMNVRQNVEFGLKMKNKSQVQARRRVDETLSLLDLERMEHRSPATLSGGERQKVVLARVLATEPRITLLDEPLAAIDAEASRTLRKELKRINRNLKTTMLHVTHDQMEAFSLAHRIGIIKDGQIRRVDSPRKLLEDPNDVFVASFLGYRNIFEVELVKRSDGTSQASVKGQMIKVASELAVGRNVIAIRPEYVKISREASPSEQENVFSGIITEYEDQGPIANVTVDVGFSLEATIDKSSFYEMGLDVGTRVHASFKAESAKVLNSSGSH